MFSGERRHAPSCWSCCNDAMIIAANKRAGGECVLSVCLERPEQITRLFWQRVHNHLNINPLQHRLCFRPWNCKFPRIKSTESSDKECSAPVAYQACKGFLSLFWDTKSSTAVFVAAIISDLLSFLRPYALEVNRHAVWCFSSGISKQDPIRSAPLSLQVLR